MDVEKLIERLGSVKRGQSYAAEFDFRYSNRIALGVNDTMRADRLLAGVVGKRLTYRATGGAV